MSPEEVLQRPITAASDIFSLGIVLYELASGTNPFRGDSAGATTRLIQGMETPPLPAQGKAVPQELDRLVRAMLSKSPEDRPTASEVALRLEAIAQPRMFRRRAVWVAAALAICGSAAWPPGAWLPSQSGGRQARSAAESASHQRAGIGNRSRFLAGWQQPRLRLRRGLARDSSHHDPQCAGLASGGAGSNQPLTLTSAPQDDTNPVWSPDGSRIAFLRRTGGETLQAIVIPSGGGPEQVVASLPGSRPGARKFLTWAPDGEALVGALRLEGRFALRLYRFPLSGGAAQPVTEGPDGAQDVSPAFSPDGRWLAFLRWENGATYTALGSSAAGWKAEAAGHESGSDFLVCVESRQPDHRVWRWRNQHGRTTGKSRLRAGRRSRLSFWKAHPTRSPSRRRVAGWRTCCRISMPTSGACR